MQSSGGVWLAYDVQGRKLGVQTLYIHTGAVRDVRWMARNRASIWVCAAWIKAHGEAALASIEKWVSRAAAVSVEVDGDIWPLLTDKIRTEARLVAMVEAGDWMASLSGTDVICLKMPLLGGLLFEVVDGRYQEQAQIVPLLAGDDGPYHTDVASTATSEVQN